MKASRYDFGPRCFVLRTSTPKVFLGIGNGEWNRVGKVGRLGLETMEYWKIGILEEWVDNV